jgi:hypothetical protein
MTTSIATTSLAILKASIGTSLQLKLFPTKSESATAHIYSSVPKMLTQHQILSLQNFNSKQRLQPTLLQAYPKTDRPRGNSDLKSVRYFQKLLLNKHSLPNIWVYRKNKQMILLDGAHRLVANHLHGNKTINAYVIQQ